MVDLFYQQTIWLALFALFSIVFLYIVKKNGIRYFYFFFVGALIGFITDLISVSFGYYSLPTSIYFINVFDLIPLTMTLMEGMAIVFVLYFFEKVILPRIGRR